MNIYSHFSAAGKRLEPFPFIVELAMEGYIVENQEILKLSDDDEPQVIELEKEWKRGKEKEENRGRIDLLVSYGDSIYAIVELKNDILTVEAFTQLKSYFEDKKHLGAVSASIADTFELGSKDHSISWRGVLVGTGIEPQLKEDIEKYNSNSDIPFAVIILNRYKCDNQIYTLTDIAVSPKKGRNHSKYEFKGRLYTKGRLVLALIKSYVEENYDKTNASELKNRLSSIKPKYFPILMDYQDAVDKTNTPNAKGNIVRYYFIKPEEAIEFKDGAKLAVLDWWEIKDMPIIKEIAKILGFTFKLVS